MDSVTSLSQIASLKPTTGLPIPPTPQLSLTTTPIAIPSGTGNLSIVVTGTPLLSTTMIAGTTPQANQSEALSTGSTSKISTSSAISSATSTATTNAAVEVKPMFGIGAAGVIFAGLLGVV